MYIYIYMYMYMCVCVYKQARKKKSFFHNVCAASNDDGDVLLPKKGNKKIVVLHGAMEVALLMKGRREGGIQGRRTRGWMCIEVYVVDWEGRRGGSFCLFVCFYIRLFNTGKILLL